MNEQTKAARERDLVIEIYIEGCCEADSQTGLIREIRAYYASPQATDLDRLELGGFDYEGRGFPPGVRD